MAGARGLDKCNVLDKCICSYDDDDTGMNSKPKIKTIDCKNLFLTAIPRRSHNVSNRIDSINLAGNYIETFDYKYLTGLHVLTVNAEQNRISTFAGGNWTNSARFRVFNLSSNKLTALSPDSFMPVQYTLRRLILSKNQLKSSIEFDLAFKHLNLDFLDLSYNQLVFLPNLNHQVNMQFLNYNNNHIETLELTGDQLAFNSHFVASPFSSSLIELHLAFNRLKTIKEFWLTNLFKLIKLDLANNRIAFINRNAFKNMHELEYLIMRGNHLNRIPSEVFFKLNRLSHLDLSFQTKPIVFISDFAFDRENAQSDLHTVILDGNQIESVSDKAFCSNSNGLHKNVRIQSLSLQGNRLKNANPCTFRQLNEHNDKSRQVQLKLETVLIIESLTNRPLIDCWSCQDVNFLKRNNIYTNLSCMHSIDDTMSRRGVQYCNDASEKTRLDEMCHDAKYTCSNIHRPSNGLTIHRNIDVYLVLNFCFVVLVLPVFLEQH